MSIQLTDKTQVIDLIVDELNCDIDGSEFEDWVDSRLLLTGPVPWMSSKELTFQQGLNSILRHELIQRDYDTSHLRGYLEDSDPLKVWVKNVAWIISEHIKLS